MCSLRHRSGTAQTGWSCSRRCVLCVNGIDFFLTVAAQQRIGSEEGQAITQRLATELEPHRVVNIDPYAIDLYVGRYRNSSGRLPLRVKATSCSCNLRGMPAIPPILYPSLLRNNRANANWFR